MVNKYSDNAVALLCRYPDNIWLNFLNNFNKYDIYIIIDENKNDYDELYKHLNHKLNIIQIDDNYCIQNGFYNFVHPTPNLPNKPLSWDKALLYFTRINRLYNHIWFIEDDVFILREDVLLNIDNKYINSDLLTPFHHVNYDGNLTSWNLWYTIKDKISLPWARSMTCACRASNKLLKLMDNYRLQNNKLFFHEAMFNTIALQNNLLVETPEELSTIHYRTEWDINNLNLNYLYHPIKNYIDQLTLKMNNNIYYDNLFNNINYNNIQHYKFNELLFLSKHLPEGFNISIYKKYDDLKFFSDEELIYHFFKYGQYESRIYK